jgi:lipopolysaccharide transport system ATP-binding protein
MTALSDSDSSAPQPVLILQDVSKAYEIWHTPMGRARAALRRSFGRNPRGDFTRSRKEVTVFQALHPCSLIIRRGEAVALIGRNGSGKSTLLQIVAGTLAPSSGTVRVTGRVGALLELGSGFNPEFTGRENAMLHASVLGVSIAEAEARFPEICAFADIGDFIDVPLKAYSSGMVVRLAFAVQTAYLPDVLIVDEALAVGDAFFQRKCFDRIDRFLQEGGTLLFVSHDTGLVQRLCARAILLDHGRVVADADPASVVKRYYQLSQGDLGPAVATPVPPATAQPTSEASTEWMEMPLKRDWISGTGGAHIASFSLIDFDGRARSGFKVGEWVRCRMVVTFQEAVDSVHIGIGLRDTTGTLQGGLHNLYTRDHLGPLRAGASVIVEAELALDLPPGDYLFLLGSARPVSPYEWQDLYSLWDCAKLEIAGPPIFWGKASLRGRFRSLQIQDRGGH